MTSQVKNGRMKICVILTIVLLAFGLLLLLNSPDGLSAAHRMLMDIVELWKDFISRDIVGIV